MNREFKKRLLNCILELSKSYAREDTSVQEAITLLTELLLGEEPTAPLPWFPHYPPNTGTAVTTWKGLELTTAPTHTTPVPPMNVVDTLDDDED